MCTVERQVPLQEWLQEAVRGFQEIKESWGCPTLSALHKDGCLSMATLRKLDPLSPDPSISKETVVAMIGKLMNMAQLLFVGEDLARVNATLASVLAKVVMAYTPLTASDKAKAEERKRIRYRHQNC